jgi:predicted DNA-binding transcriptional regulator AlpA
MSGALTMRQIRELPAAIDPETAAAALGLSRSWAYESLRRGDFPARAIKVSGRWRVITSSVIDLLEQNGTARPSRT